jgi:hypothetical protein
MVIMPICDSVAAIACLLASSRVNWKAISVQRADNRLRQEAYLHHAEVLPPLLVKVVRGIAAPAVLGVPGTIPLLDAALTSDETALVVAVGLWFALGGGGRSYSNGTAGFQ